MKRLYAVFFLNLFIFVQAYGSGDSTPTPTPTPEPARCVLRAVPDELWPPNHKFVPITFVDEEGYIVSPTIAGVFQDEPTRVIGSGAFCPDAAIGEDASFSGGEASSVSVRSERSGAPRVPGDGRVYHIFFTLETIGGMCEGEVTVCVPHDQGPDNDCIDGGPLYDSLACVAANKRGGSVSTGKSKSSTKRKSGKSGKGKK